MSAVEFFLNLTEIESSVMGFLRNAISAYNLALVIEDLCLLGAFRRFER